MSNILTPFSKTFNVLTRDLVITIDYKAQYCTSTLLTDNYGGFVLGFLPYYHPTPDGYSAADGLGYASVSGLMADGISLSADGIQDALLGIGFDFAGTFSVSGTVGTGGLSAATPNSISLRGPAPSYDFITATRNLTTYPIPFNLYEETNQIKSARIRVSDFGRQILVDLRPSLSSYYTNYINCNLPSPLLSYNRFYIGYTGPLGLGFKIKNVNVNGYDETINYFITGADYIGKSDVFPLPGEYLNEGDTINFINKINTTSTLFSSYSGLDPLILPDYTTDNGMPYIANDGFVLIQYSI